MTLTPEEKDRRTTARRQCVSQPGDFAFGSTERLRSMRRRPPFCVGTLRVAQKPISRVASAGLYGMRAANGATTEPELDEVRERRHGRAIIGAPRRSAT